MQQIDQNRAVGRGKEMLDGCVRDEAESMYNRIRPRAKEIRAEGLGKAQDVRIRAKAVA